MTFVFYPLIQYNANQCHCQQIYRLNVQFSFFYCQNQEDMCSNDNSLFICLFPYLLANTNHKKRKLARFMNIIHSIAVCGCSYGAFRINPQLFRSENNFLVSNFTTKTHVNFSWIYINQLNYSFDRVSSRFIRSF